MTGIVEPSGMQYGISRVFPPLKEKDQAVKKKKRETIIVEQGNYKVIGLTEGEQAELRTVGVGPCVAVGIGAKTQHIKIYSLAHFDSGQKIHESLEIMLGIIRGFNVQGNLQVYVAGGQKGELFPLVVAELQSMGERNIDALHTYNSGQHVKNAIPNVTFGVAGFQVWWRDLPDGHNQAQGRIVWKYTLPTLADYKTITGYWSYFDTLYRGLNKIMDLKLAIDAQVAEGAIAPMAAQYLQAAVDNTPWSANYIPKCLRILKADTAKALDDKAKVCDAQDSNAYNFLRDECIAPIFRFVEAASRVKSGEQLVNVPLPPKWTK